MEGLTPSQKDQILGMIVVDPLGALPAKVMLKQVDGTAYHRVPWMIDDTRAGLKGAEIESTHSTEVMVWLNPASNSSRTLLQSVRIISEFGSL